MKALSYYLIDAWPYCYLGGRPEWEPVFRCDYDGNYHFTYKWWFGNEKTFTTQIESYRKLLHVLKTPESGYTLGVVSGRIDGPLDCPYSLVDPKRFEGLCAHLKRFDPSPRSPRGDSRHDGRNEWVDEDGFLWKIGRTFKDGWKGAMGIEPCAKIVSEAYKNTEQATSAP